MYVSVGEKNEQIKKIYQSISHLSKPYCDPSLEPSQ